MPISLKSFTVELPGMSTASRIPPTSPPFQAWRTYFTHRARGRSRTSCAWMTYTRRCSITSAKAHSSCSVSAMYLPKTRKAHRFRCFIHTRQRYAYREHRTGGFYAPVFHGRLGAHACVKLRRPVNPITEHGIKFEKRPSAASACQKKPGMLRGRSPLS